MRSHYILVEGINLYKNMLDTDQLSVIRGTSFLYKNTISEVATHFSSALSALSTGASSGLFLYTGATSLLECIRAIEDFLALHPRCLLPFAVEHCEADNCLAAKRQLISTLRLRQMQRLSVQPDLDHATAALSGLPCELTGYRDTGQRIGNSRCKPAPGKPSVGSVTALTFATTMVARRDRITIAN